MAAIAENSVDTITANQAARLIIATQFPIGVLTVARLAVDAACHDGWIVLVIAGLIITFAKIIIAVLCNRFGGASIIDIDKKLFGKYIGTFLNLLWTAYLLFAAIVNFAFFLLSIKLWFFKYTPVLLIAVLLISPTLLLVNKGLKNICRFTIILYVMLLITVLLLVYGATRLRVTLLLPICEEDLLKMLGSLPIVSFSFIGFETLLFIYPNIKNKKDVIKSAWKSGTIITSFYVATSIVTVCLFGTQYTSQSLYPMTSLAKFVKFPVFERIDLYYYALWVPGMILCTNTYVFCTCNTIKRIFNIKKPFWITVGICLILILVSIRISDVDMTEALGNTNGYLSCLIGIAVPLILLPLSLIFGKGGSRKNGSGKRKKEKSCGQENI